LEERDLILEDDYEDVDMGEEEGNSDGKGPSSGKD
jgi:hypothetical protein